MEVRCVSFTRLTDPRGRYALLARRRNGDTLFPIGGELDVFPSGKYTLIRLGADGFKREFGLRFEIDVRQLPDVIRWFNKRIGREASVLRKLCEELVDETELLAPGDLDGITEECAGFALHGAKTQSVHLIEVYDVTVRPSTLVKLCEAAAQQSSPLHFASKTAIQQHRVPNGPKIDPSARRILDPRPKGGPLS